MLFIKCKKQKRVVRVLLVGINKKSEAKCENVLYFRFILVLNTEKQNIYVVFNLIYKRNKTQEWKCNNSTQSFINK